MAAFSFWRTAHGWKRLRLAAKGPPPDVDTRQAGDDGEVARHGHNRRRHVAQRLANGAAGELYPETAGDQQQLVVLLLGANEQCPESDIENGRAEIEISRPRRHISISAEGEVRICVVSPQRNRREEHGAANYSGEQQAARTQVFGGAIRSEERRVG